MRIVTLSPHARALVPIASLIVLLAVLVLESRSRPPEIEQITPRIASSGEVLTITGSNFGGGRAGGEVRIAGVSPTSGAYLEWLDHRISVRVPEEVRSGYVYVVAGGARSNGLLFANRDFLPVVISGPASPGQPYVAALDRPRAAVGELVVLTGTNFGLQRGDSQMLFTWRTGGASEAEAAGGRFIAASEHDLDYEAWSDTEVHVRVPDGAATGNLLVETDKGRSNEVFFEVSGAVGTKRFHSRRTYSVAVDLSVSDVSATRPNELYLWVPRIWPAPAQRDVQVVVREPEPLYDDVSGVTVFHLRDLVTGGVYDVTQHFIFERYAVETVVSPRRVVPYDAHARSYLTFSAPDPLVPADDADVTAVAARVAGGDDNPWNRARMLYDYLRTHVAYRPTRAADPLEVLRSGGGDAYDFAILYTALLRAAGVPARPVAGYLIQSPHQPHPHFWTEFYLHQFGWVPVDPALGAGAALVTPEAKVEPEDYYFGNLGNRHLVLSKGLTATDQIDPAARTLRRPELGTLQLLHEEAAGGLSSYRVRWGGLTILGVY